MKALLVPIAALALGLSGCGDPESTSPEDVFTDTFIAAYGAEVPEARIVKRGPLRLEVRHRGRSYTMYLDNAFREHQRAPHALPDIVARHAASHDRVPEDDDEIDPRQVVPLIKDVVYLAEVRPLLETEGKPEAFPYHEALNEQLAVLYVEDTEHSMQFLNPKQVASLGLEPAELRGRAVENLRRKLPAIEIVGGPSIYMVVAGGNYEVSLLLDDAFWDDPRLQVPGDVVVGIPARDVLVVAGSGDRAGIARLRSLAAETLAKAAYALTDRLFVRRNGGWVVFAD